MRATDIPNFENLTDVERLQLAEDLIASVRNPEIFPPDLHHRLELERRWAEFQRDPSSALSEEQFWTQVRAGRR
jgi:putative addiction module component (TIGR02574 family)